LSGCDDQKCQDELVKWRDIGDKMYRAVHKRLQYNDVEVKDCLRTAGFNYHYRCRSHRVSLGIAHTGGGPMALQAILTVIAAALVALVIEQGAQSAGAQFRACEIPGNSCRVTNGPSSSMWMLNEPKDAIYVRPAE
jgi:hypothetical protein